MQEATIRHSFYLLFILQPGFKNVALKAIIQVARLLEGLGPTLLKWAWLLGMDCTNMDI
jgi:hypothetical protein